MRPFLTLFSLLLAALPAGAQQKGFLIQGRVDLPDGTEVGLTYSTESSFSNTAAQGVVKQGRFTLKGSVQSPSPAMLTTNNLRLVEKNRWPQDSIRWTYTDLYLANDTYSVSPDLSVQGGEAQTDFNALQAAGGSRGPQVWAFITEHPRSVVSLGLANTLLQRGYSLTDQQVELLAATLQENPLDPQGWQRYQTRLAAARKTTLGSPLVSLEVRDTANRPMPLADVVPQNGKYVLLDFWASWCGICLYAMPDIRALRERYADRLEVVGISIDEKDAAWRQAMAKHPEPWAQYCTTASGYRDLTDKLQIGNGVPYYLLLSPEGKVIASPSNSREVEAKLLELEGKYRVMGRAEGTTDGDSVFICAMRGFFSLVPLDTAIVKEGEFAFSGTAEGAQLLYMVPLHAGETVGMVPFILEPGSTYMELRAGEQQPLIEGGPNHRLYQDYLAGDNRYNQLLEEPWALVMDSTATAEERRQAQARVDSITALQRAYHKEFLLSHVPSAFSDMLLPYIQQEMDEEEFSQVLTLLGEQQPQYPMYKAFMAERAAQEATAIGKRYLDIEMPGPDGKPVRVSDYVAKNRYTLIDFWASWCGPCRAEMPNVVKAYTKYRKKGFEVVGVSFDTNKAAWLKGLEQLQMPWPQMSDLKGWESAAAALYNVRAIPANVLVDRSGTIVAKDLREEALLQKLAELF